jgi:hypothetical protein
VDALQPSLVTLVTVVYIAVVHAQIVGLSWVLGVVRNVGEVDNVWLPWLLDGERLGVSVLLQLVSDEVVVIRIGLPHLTFVLTPAWFVVVFLQHLGSLGELLEIRVVVLCLGELLLVEAYPVGLITHLLYLVVLIVLLPVLLRVVHALVLVEVRQVVYLLLTLVAFLVVDATTHGQVALLLLQNFLRVLLVNNWQRILLRLGSVGVDILVLNDDLFVTLVKFMLLLVKDLLC